MKNIPDYSNIQFSMADMERFFKDSDVQLDDKSKEKLNSIFQKCDKRDTQGQKVKGGDGLLTGDERESFVERIKKKMPELYEQIIDFTIAVDIIEDSIKQQQATKQLLKKDDVKNMTPKFGQF